MPAYERILLGVNPVSSNANRAPAILDNLENGGLGIPVEVLQTVPGGLNENRERFAGALRPGDLFITIAGDGGHREMASSLLVVDDELAQNVTTTTLGGGEASDKFHALHGAVKSASPTTIVKRGVSKLSRPLITTLTWLDNKPQEHPAFSYVGFGKSAEGAAIVNTAAYRARNKLLREAALLGQIIFGDTEFLTNWRQPETNPGPDIQYQSEVAVIIGSRMAKYGRLPVEHWDERMFLMRERPGTLRAAYALTRLAIRRPIGEHVKAVDFYTMGPTTAQFDGEVMPVPEGARVVIDRHPRALNLLVSPEQCLPSHMIPKDPDAPHVHF